jgi:predicted RNA methylase
MNLRPVWKTKRLRDIGYVKRFDGRVDVYSRYRPRYPHELIERLEEEVGFNEEKIVADIGSGTGILSELFLENGNMVYCVEPNNDMRRVAESTSRGTSLDS